MDKENNSSIEIEISTHKLTKEEFKEYKKNLRKETRERHRENRIEKRRIRKNYRSLNTCMVHPKNIVIGNLEKCLYSRCVNEFFIAGTLFGHIDEKYEPIEGEKVFIKLKDNIECYVELNKVNTNNDIIKIGKHISANGIILGDKILNCDSGKIRINRDSLRSHPLFENETQQISIKQLKKKLQSN